MKFKQEGTYKYIPYNKLFRRTEIVEIEGYGKFEGYANRDSLKYLSVYGLDNINTIYRGTLRRKGFCRAWDVFVQLGATDDSYVIEGSQNMTHRDFINSFLAYNIQDSVELKLKHYLHIDQDSEVFEKLVWLGIFDKTKVESIPIGCFWRCESLRNLQLPDGITYIDSNAFCHCSELSDITMPYSLIAIGDFSFAHCYKLKNLVIHPRIRSIGEDCFLNCENLNSIRIEGSKLISLGKFAFFKCVSLQEVDLSGQSISEIKESTFEDCSLLKLVKLPKTLQVVENRAFWNCRNLEQLQSHSN